MYDLYVAIGSRAAKGSGTLKESDKEGACGIEQFFYGSVTVGERGQVVIPAKARRDYGIEFGDQLLIMGHPSKNGLMIAKVDAIRSFLTKMIDDLKFIESQRPSSGEPDADASSAESKAPHAMEGPE